VCHLGSQQFVESACRSSLLAAAPSVPLPPPLVYLCLTILILASACNSTATAPPLPDAGKSAREPSSSRVGQQETLLAPSPADLDFPTLSKGSRRELTFWLHNPGTEAVVVAAVRTDCDCLAVTLEDTVVGPGQRVAATAIIDLRSDPYFSGGLCPQARGITNDGARLAFIITVNIRVH
jgi:hypothetical protein